jgi:hypothetical protein
VASERVGAKKEDVDQEHARAHTDAEFALVEECAAGVIRQDEQIKEGHIKGIAMDVLEYQEACFALVVPVGYGADGAGRRCPCESAIIGLPVVIAREPK